MYNLIKVLKIHDSAVIPSKATAGSTGLDLYAVENTLLVGNGGIEVVGTGLVLDLRMLPIGADVQVRPRSGLAAKHGITVLNSPGTIDRDYLGELKVILINHGKSDYQISTGDRVAQLIIGNAITSTSLFPVEDIGSVTARGFGGLGSTGK